MKFIFQTLPGYGHLNPMLGVAEALVQKGHTVIVYNTKDFKKEIESIGAIFREPPVEIIENTDFRILRNTIHIARLSLHATELITKPLIEIIKNEKPDCLIHDSLGLWGKIAGLYTHTPTVSLNAIMAMNAKVLMTYTKYLLSEYTYMAAHPFISLMVAYKYQKVYKKMGLKPPLLTDIYCNVEKLNIIFTSRYFQPLQSSFGNSFKFVGPIIWDREKKQPPLKIEKNKQIIYVALGTVYNDNIDTYRKLIQILGNTKYQVFMSIGKWIQTSDLQPLPQNIQIKSYFPQLKLLKNASLFISHAGMNSVNESLYFGVPLLMLPIIQEQKINAARVEELGAGIYYKKNKINVAEFSELINRMLKDQLYKKHAQQVQKTLIAAGGAQKAVEYILDYLAPLGVA